jgi:hypothetical protein
MSNLNNKNSYLVNKLYPTKKLKTSDKLLSAIFCIFFLSLCFFWFYVLTNFLAAFFITAAVGFIASMVDLSN